MKLPRILITSRDIVVSGNTDSMASVSNKINRFVFKNDVIISDMVLRGDDDSLDVFLPKRF